MCHHAGRPNGFIPSFPVQSVGILSIAAVASLLVPAAHLGYTLCFYVALGLERRTTIKVDLLKVRLSPCLINYESHHEDV
jgi:hypothetical protein